MGDLICPIRYNNPTLSREIDNQQQKSWATYKEKMIEADGRPLAEIDKNDVDSDGLRFEQVTYSEAVAYVMLRAVWMSDEETFTKVWSWAQNNLQRNNPNFQTWVCTKEDFRAKTCRTWKPWNQLAPEQKASNPKCDPDNYNDHLFAWRYVPTLPVNGKPGEKGGILCHESFKGIDRSGYNAASDDVEIAAALYFASLRNWGGRKEIYLESAQNILNDAWEKYVVDIGGKYYFMAGDQFSYSGTINSSYFRPAYFRHVFPEIDPFHPWHKLAEDSYEIINQSGQLTLSDGKHARNGRGVNLPSNWLDLSSEGELTDSNMFPGKVGQAFGWDAFRVLYAVAQDYAWYGDGSAHAYLTDPNIGPIDFLSRNLKGGTLPSLFNHDGTRISGQKGDLAFYGAYLPYFCYAGKGKEAGDILNYLNRSYDDAGFWKQDRYREKWAHHYYTQNWVWFGLALANGIDPALENELKALPAPAQLPDEKIMRRSLNPPVFHVDPELGIRTADGRPVLGRNLIEKKLTIEQMAETLRAIDTIPYIPDDDTLDHKPQNTIRAIDQKHQYELVEYFSDSRTYWNNAITLLSVYSQKLNEEDRKEDFDKVTEYAARIKLRVAQWEKKLSFAIKDDRVPPPYNRVVLEMPKAEIISQTKGQPFDVYEEAIGIVAASIRTLLDVNPNESLPDYHSIARALLMVGDLYVRMQEVTRDESYLDKAAQFYGYVATIDKGTVIRAPEEGIFVPDFSPLTVDTALFFNHQKGHLNSEMLDEALKASAYLKGIAMIRDVSLFTRRKGKKSREMIEWKIEECDRAIKELKTSIEGKPEKTDYFLSFAQIVKADLLLALADRTKYDSPGAAKLAKSKIEQAENIFSNIPAKFKFLYAWAKTKIAEIAARDGKFITKEFRYRYPFYTVPLRSSKIEIGGNNVIPSEEFLGIEQDYFKAILLISSKKKENYKEAAVLLERVKANATKLSDPLYQKYFAIHAELKAIELAILNKADRTGKVHMSGQEYAKIADRLTALATAAGVFNREQLDEMAWRPHSFLAELYHEWALLNQSLGKTDQARRLAVVSLKNCFKSDSQYDMTMRRFMLRVKFKLFDEDSSLLAQRNRGTTNER